MPRTITQWLVLAVVIILAGNVVAFAGILLQSATQLHPTIIAALMVLLGAAISGMGFLVDWLRR